MPTTHLTLTTAGHAPLFAGFNNARAMIRKMQALEQQKTLHSLAWSLVPDQLQWLIVCEEEALESIIKNLQISAVQALNPVIHQGPVWQQPTAHTLQPQENPRTMARHILAAPYRAGLVERPGDHPHWDSAWL